MMEVTLKDGTVKVLDLDVDAIIAYEAENPDWSLISLFTKGGDNLRFSDIDILSRLIGFDGLKDALDKGVGYPTIVEAVAKSSIMGFTDTPEEED